MKRFTEFSNEPGRREQPIPRGILTASRFLGALAAAAIGLSGIAQAATGASPRQSGDLKVTFGNEGLTSLRYGGVELLSKGMANFASVNMLDADGHSTPADLASTGTADLVTHTYTRLFAWGALRTRYQVSGNRLGIEFTVTNASDKTIPLFLLQPLQLVLPEPPAEYRTEGPMLASNIGAPGLVTLTCRFGKIAVVNEDVVRPLMCGFPWALDRPANKVFPLFLNTGRNGMYPTSLPTIDRPIAAHASDTFAISLRFGNTNATILDLAGDLFAKFAKAWPSSIHWEDRRPIGSLFLASSGQKWPSNPRGWFNDPGVDVTRPAGIARFQKRLLAYADHAIAHLKALHAQGMITWDIEGEQYPQGTTFIGDPSLAGTLAPEVAGVADQYFKKFRDAGFRVGVTIRPQRLELGGSVTQREVSDPGAVLAEKIAYARRRWGATLFYVDSNGDRNDPLDARVFSKIAAANPDILLIPEMKNMAYYACTAPYSELRSGFTGPSADILAAYPRAFNVINVADGNLEGYFPQLLAAVRNGTILLSRAWFDDRSIPKVRAIYKKAEK